MPPFRRSEVKEAHPLRASGMSWREIKESLGTDGVLKAKTYAARTGAPWPVPRRRRSG